MVKYKIIDNFLNEQDFNELCLLSLKNIKNKEIHVYKNQIHKNGDLLKNDCLSEETIKRFMKNYHQKAMEILKELSPEKANLYDYTKFDIVNIGPEYKFTIHDDQPETLLSTVVYLSPYDNTGTSFYDNKRGNNKKNIKWKQNRALFFSRIERKTWHSFQGNGKTNRVTLILNLMTRDIKSVCKIEGTNYYLSQFRNYINPYLYRFLKFTI